MFDKAACCLCENVMASGRMYRIADGYVCVNCIKKLGGDLKIVEKFFGKPIKMWTSEMLKGLEKEKRKKCNVCGQIFCYREGDIVRAMRQADIAKWSLIAGTAHALGGSAAAGATYQTSAITMRRLAGEESPKENDAAQRAPIRSRSPLIHPIRREWQRTDRRPSRTKA